ncbi:hypothetical protein SAMN04489761_3473 [Tenacibaculum sp. MAR_2009_124]|nr:hypothetical protein SAMN04489761_3473 [Tenacibaculum sp. MAR_2009_124]
MYKVYMIATGEPFENNFGELLIDREHYFTLHSSSKEFDKANFFYKKHI